jgi:hypothetical protein
LQTCPNNSTIMKPIIFLFLLLAGCRLASAQLPSSCTVPPVLNTIYNHDVRHLALKRIYDLQSPARNSIVIPQSYQDTIQEAMAAIFNLSGLPARDTVFDIYCIHHMYSEYLVYTISVELSPSCPWAQQWHNLITPTGVPALDSLLAKYGFTVTAYIASMNSVELTTTQSINCSPLCDSLMTFAGIVSADPNFPARDGNKIYYSKSGTDRFLDFRIGYGDCPVGCTSWYILQFKVFSDCSVSYLGSVANLESGMPFPFPVNCNITQGIAPVQQSFRIGVFPNPAADEIALKLPAAGPVNFDLFNSTGHRVLSGKIRDKETLSLQGLAPGIYLVRLTDPVSRESGSARFIKIN